LWDHVLFLSNLHLFHDELVEGVQILFFLFSPLFSILVDPVRGGLSPLLVGAYCFLIPFPDSRRRYGMRIKGRGVPRFFCPLLFMLKPSYACTLVDHSISMVLVVTTTPPQTIEMS
jgi:hypothetical protein